MFKSKSMLSLCVFFIVLLFASGVYAFDLTGVWSCDDGGTYYVRQLGDTVWWYGEQSPTNPGWSNVAHGTLDGNELTLTWADIPKGRVMGKGRLILVVSGNGTRLTATDKTGGFGGNNWRKQ